MTAQFDAAAHVEHLTDDGPVFIPFMSVGHHRPEDPAASPEAVECLGVGGTHPYSGKTVAAVRLADQRIFVVAVDRLSHARGCLRCDATWVRLSELIDDIPEGASISAAAHVDTRWGSAMLLVDAEDLDAEDADES